MPLTAKQEAFAQAILQGASQADAYKAAGYKWESMLPATVHEEACKLAANPKVSTRIHELRQPAIDKLAWNYQRFLEAAESQRLGAVTDHQWAPANGALKLIGDATGLLSSHVDVNVTHTLKPGLSLEELEARVLRLDALEAGIIEGEAVVLEEGAEEEDE